MRYFALFVLIISQVAAAQDAGKKSPQVVELECSPADEPSPIFKYRFRPSFLDMSDQNSVAMYFQARELLPSDYQDKAKQVNEWITMPIDELPMKEVTEFVATLDPVFNSLNRAVLREQFQMDLPLREEHIGLLLPHLSPFRDLARCIALKAKLHTANNEPTNAISTLMLGFRFAQHVGEGDTLIERLVAVSIAQMMLEQVDSLIQLKDAPNLYWALAELPRPLISMPDALFAERTLIYMAIPKLRDVTKDIESREDWSEVAEVGIQMLKLFSQLGNGDSDNVLAAVTKQTAAGKAIYNKARAYVLSLGIPETKLNDMPHPAVICIHWVHQYEVERDRLMRWAYLPFPIAIRGMNETEKMFNDSNSDLSPIAKVLLPAIKNAVFAGIRIDRKVAQLMTVESVRIHLANHKKLPASLSDLNQAPPLPDPATGRLFGYRLDDEAAVIEAPAPQGFSEDRGLTYQLRIRPE